MIVPRPLVLLTLLLFLKGHAMEADREDVRTLDGIIAAYYAVVSGPAGERADAARDRSLHHPAAVIAIARLDAAGQPVVEAMSLDDYHGANAPRAEAFYEKELDRRVQRSGNMAHVWSTYGIARTADGEPERTGVNSITLFNDGQRWWIMSWMFDASVH